MSTAPDVLDAVPKWKITRLPSGSTMTVANLPLFRIEIASSEGGIHAMVFAASNGPLLEEAHFPNSTTAAGMSWACERALLRLTETHRLLQQLGGARVPL